MSTRQTASQLYTLAYNAHYVTFDLIEAMERYSSVIDEFPDSRQARDARIQLQQIKLGLVSPEWSANTNLAPVQVKPEEELPTWFRNLLLPPVQEQGPPDE